MFHLNVGHQWTLAGTDGLKGIVLLPSYIYSERIVRKADFNVPSLLLDPQLYLIGIEAESRTKACSRLASYPWFGVDVPEFESDGQTRRDWEMDIRERIDALWSGEVPEDPLSAAYSAVEFQITVGCTTIILPTPLMTEREAEGEVLGEWLDAGLEAADDQDAAVPILATIAVDESVLNEASFGVGGLLEALVDEVTARDGIDGVYIVVAQRRAVGHPFQAHAAVVRAYFHLSCLSSRSGMSEILCNFADVAGLAAAGAGATGFATGQSHALRALNLEGFRDDGFGRPYPRLYSNPACTEYLTESDLDQIVRLRLLRRVSDSTAESARLMEVLRRGGTAAQLPNWAEAQGNMKSAQKHFVQRMVREGKRMARTQSLSDRRDLIMDWLEGARASTLFIANRVGSELGRSAPVDEWRDLIFDSDPTDLAE